MLLSPGSMNFSLCLQAQGSAVPWWGEIDTNTPLSLKPSLFKCRPGALNWWSCTVATVFFFFLLLLFIPSDFAFYLLFKHVSLPAKPTNVIDSGLTVPWIQGNLICLCFYVSMRSMHFFLYSLFAFDWKHIFQLEDGLWESWNLNGEDYCFHS